MNTNTNDSARPASSQQTFKQMVATGLAPRLRTLGFTGSGSTFNWPSETSFARIGLQRSRDSNRTALRFTINVTVADKSAWEQASTSRTLPPARPAANTFYAATPIWQSRIGRLLPGGDDHWWHIEAGQDWQPIAHDVLDAIQRYALPEIVRRTTTDSRKDPS